MKKLLLSTSCILALVLASGNIKAEVVIAVETGEDIIISQDTVDGQEISENKDMIIIKNLATSEENVWEGINIVPIDSTEALRVKNDDTIKPEDKIKILKELKSAEENRIIKAYDDQRNKFLDRIYELKDKDELTDEEKEEIKKIQRKINVINAQEDGAIMEIEKYFY